MNLHSFLTCLTYTHERYEFSDNLDSVDIIYCKLLRTFTDNFATKVGIYNSLTFTNRPSYFETFADIFNI